MKKKYFLIMPCLLLSGINYGFSQEANFLADPNSLLEINPTTDQGPRRETYLSAESSLFREKDFEILEEEDEIIAEAFIGENPIVRERTTPNPFEGITTDYSLSADKEKKSESSSDDSWSFGKCLKYIFGECMIVSGEILDKVGDDLDPKVNIILDAAGNIAKKVGEKLVDSVEKPKTNSTTLTDTLSDSKAKVDKVLDITGNFVKEVGKTVTNGTSAQSNSGILDKIVDSAVNNSKSKISTVLNATSNLVAKI
jgi:hypothetical protein